VLATEGQALSVRIGSVRIGSVRIGWARVVVIGLVAAIAPVVAAVPSAATGGPPPDAPAGSVTTYQGNALHDGYSSDEFTTPIGRLWSRDFGQRAGYPLVVNGRVFVATADVGGAQGTELWALDASDGSILWGPIALGGGGYLNGIAADGANVYSVTYHGLLRAFDQATGAPGWSVLLPGQSSFTSPPTVRNGIVYTAGAGSGGTLYAVDAETGGINWSASVTNGDHSSPVVTADGVYVSYACQLTHKFDPITGAVVWTHTTSCSGGGGSTPVLHGSSLYVRDLSYGPAVLSTTTGTQTGSFSSTAAPAFSADRMFTLANSNLRAIDVATGTIKWTQAGDGGLVSAPIVIGEAVAVGSSTGMVYLYDTTSGALLWSANAGSPIIAPEEHNDWILAGMAESAGTLFVPASNRLVAYRADTVTATPSTAAFGEQRVGTYGAAKSITIRNTGTSNESLTDITIDGADPRDFFGETDCFPAGKPRTLAAGASCHATMYFGATAPGSRAATLTVSSSAYGSPDTISLSGSGTEGYILAGSRGEVGVFGDAVFHGDATRIKLAAPIISLATTPNGAGYWLLGRDGGMFSYGNAKYYGSMGGRALNKPIVGMAATAGGKGYWLVGSDGGIFSFGDAPFYGSTGGMHLQKPITSMASTPTGRGYWLIASDGGVFAYGDARFYGSTARTNLAEPIARIVPTPAEHGYWLQATDGHVYAFGDAHSYGSAPRGEHIVGMASTPDGHGYWQVSNTGAIYAFGNAHSYGNLPVRGVSSVIAIAATAPPLPPELISAGRASALTTTSSSPAGLAVPRVTSPGGRACGDPTSPSCRRAA
jgi:outer membrane protein assembly factor BamB